jgi:hypothetical protein
MKPITRLRAFAYAFPVFALLSAGCDIALADFSEQATAEWRKSYELQDGGRIEISNVNGKIEVSPGPGKAVEIYAKKIGKGANQDAAKQALERVEIADSSGGGVIKVETKVSRGGGGMFNHSSAQVEYVVRVPADAQVDLSTINGGVQVTGLTGRIKAEATNGGIVGRDIAGEIEAVTVNGGVEVQLAAVPSGGVKLECTNGGIELSLPSDAKATLSARVANGGIDTSGLNVQARESSRRRLDADLNGGGPRIALEGTNGGISIRAR